MRGARIVADALLVPSEGKLRGEPLTLLAAVSSTRDRQQLSQIVHAYWRLVETVVVYSFRWEHDRQLQQIKADDDAERVLRAARAASAAAIQEAEVMAVKAQHELATLVPFASEAPLPMPADRPQIGPYRTGFSLLFAMRPAPGRLRLIDYSLPIRRQAIDRRVLAIEAASEAQQATIDAYGQGQARLSDCLALMDESLRQRRALIASVCRYNDDIADYALSVAGPEIAGRSLVGMLIKIEDDTAIQPAGHIEAVPVWTPYSQRNLPTPARLPQTRVPTPAKRSGGTTPTPAKHPGQKTPTPAKRPQSHQPTPAKGSEEDARSPASEWLPSGPAAEETPALDPVEGAGEEGSGNEIGVSAGSRSDATESGMLDDSPSTMAERPMVPVDADSDAGAARTANKPVASNRHAWEAADPEPSRLPSELPTTEESFPPVPTAGTPGARTAQLVAALYEENTLPPGDAKPLSLTECLRTAPGGDRRRLIETYWLAAHRMAAYHVLARRVRLLEGLARQPAPESSESRRRASRMAAEADLLEAHAKLLESQRVLAVWVGRVSEAAWPIPSTVPYSGPYQAKPQAQSQPLAVSWACRRLAAAVTGLADGVQRRATAVLEAEMACAGATEAYQTGGRPVDPVLERIDRQSDQMLAFLQTVTDYNRAIAEYALTTLPPDSPQEALLAALAVRQ
ncbi:MAG: hypothetical protein JXB62_08950 [Pirellulales bacterium]|nr:hypothetical protein [Pirellulales bacterium]